MKKIIFLIFVLASFLIFSGCEFLGGNLPQKTLAKIEIDSTTIDVEVEITEFTINSVTVVLTYNDNTTGNIVLTSEMISPSDLAKLEQTGTHEITVTYQGFTTKFSITLIDTVQETFLVKFVDHDGTQLKEETVEHGKDATAPADPVRDGYSFTGWDKPLTNITSVQTITAQYQAMTYLVKFVDHDGTQLKEETVEHGKDATAPADPVRDGYSFTGWDKPLTNITSVQTITAQYQAMTYLVKFVDHDGTQLKEETVEHGKDATAPADPVRDGYSFTGWDKPLTNITSVQTITAQYQAMTYLVKFVDHDGTQLKEETVEHGKDATAPADPVRDGYSFTGWDKPLTNITSVQTITAQYQAMTYLVKFVDHDGTQLKEETVEHGKDATAPADPVRDGYSFIGWDKPLTNITSVQTITAQYQAMTYLVKFVDHDGTQLKEETVEHGKDATAPADPVRDGYSFTGWDKPLTNITSVQTITAQYQAMTYLVKFVDHDGTQLKEETVEHGKDATAPADPVRDGYSFTGWDKPLTNITSVQTITAQYQAMTYLVKFVDHDGTQLKEETVEHGKDATAPADPVRDGYSFTGWDKPLTNITSVQTITAQYQAMTYLVKFVDHDGTQLKEETVEHGKDATAPADPVRDGYSFTGWDKPLTNITSVQTITAQYQAMTYLVKFVDHDGTQLKEETVEHGKDATAPADPVRDGYSFTGWDKPLTNITSVQTITAQYQAMTYLVKFVDHDGTQLKEETVEHGKDATAPADPVRDGYSFTGWDKPLTNITSVQTITAQYQAMTYLVKFVDHDGTQLKEETVEHGKDATAPADPVRDGYSFTGWDKPLTNITSVQTITAQYQAMTYLVKFVDHDGTQLKEETVEHGKDATAPADPVRDGYSFTGWDKPLTNITSVQTITAQYQAMTYLVKFVDHDGTQLKEETVEHGKDATAPADPVRDGYSFTGWDKPLTNITSNSIITAMYEMIVVNQGNLFKVVKVSSDSSKIVIRVIMTGNPLSICSYDLRLFYPSSSLNLNTSNIIKMNGTVINYDEAGVIRLNYSSIKNIVVETTLMEIEFNVLSSTTFTFDIEVIEAVKINESYDAITVVANEEDLIVHLSDVVETYLVKFVNHDGTQLKEEMVEHGKDATAPANPVREGYSFTGWDKPLTNITSNSIITAMYEMIVVNQGNLFKVVKVSSDSSKIVIRVIMTGNPLSICSYDLRLFYPSSSLNLNTSNIIKMNGTVINYDEAGVIRLNYSSIKNIVVETTLMEIEFNVLSSTTFTFDIEVIEAVKINESYDAITVVANEEDLIVHLSDVVETYLVKFVNHDGTQLKEEMVEHGKDATAPANPVREGYSFTGWDKPLTNITSNSIITAMYEMIVVNQGNLFKVVKVSSDSSKIVIRVIMTGNPLSICSYDLRLFYPSSSLNLNTSNIIKMNGTVINYDEAGVIRLNYSSIKNIVVETTLMEIEFNVLSSTTFTFDIEVIEAVKINESYDAITVVANEEDLIVSIN